ncbi:MAG: [FeFe] hydrogenase H-cluster maturation GTPase HydF [Hyphomonadaceae bacterium]|nr:[FeFe] hydrogenase H-cluster maturation GTPase HydF [Clostridia bacterium]
MQTTPNANRKHIAIYGNTNSGKSSLLNAMVGQEVSLVSHVKGTTTDPVTKPMELIPFGAVVFIDTAGLNDTSELGEIRVKRSRKVLQRTDFAIYVMDGNEEDVISYEKTLHDFRKYNIPHMTVINKMDTLSAEELQALKAKHKNAIFVSSLKEQNILQLKDELIRRLSIGEVEETIIGDLVPANGKVILVVPVDSEAPKGRVILPQVQVLRDCLDHGIKSYVVRDSELASALEDMGKVDLVVTDSQAFHAVNQMVPSDIPLTGFSILYARYKGDLQALVDGVRQVENLQENAHILIAESCSHNHSHEDIGRVKIPKLLQAYTGKQLQFTFQMGHDFPEELSAYDMIIHCGSCMLNKKVMQTRIDTSLEEGVPITNYGVILAYMNRMLDRSLEIFQK